MSDVAIRVDDLGKQYRIKGREPGYKTLRDSVATSLNSLFRRKTRRRRPDPKSETIWALRDLSVEIKRGDVVGIIGRNGAGKSTFLKVLGSITSPTKGTVELYGRLGSLLEVGTGFHPELTGRENIYFNGAILGMKRRETDRKLDQIVAFSEVERFIDTPVKFYSSGMYLRLAFAVAAHLEPEILLVDEVLAVGDAAFQRKCLGKIEDVAREGRTVLFVSHNMAAVRTLCSRGLLLTDGTLDYEGSVGSCISRYTQQQSTANDSGWKRRTTDRTSLAIEKVTATLVGQQPDLTLNLAIHLSSNKPHKPAFMAVDLIDALGVPIMQALPTVEPFIRSENSQHRVNLEITLPPLVPGQYATTIWVGSHNRETLDKAERCFTFEIDASPTPGRTFPHTVDHGHIVPHSTFEYTTSADTTAPVSQC